MWGSPQLQCIPRAGNVVTINVGLAQGLVPKPQTFTVLLTNLQSHRLAQRCVHTTRTESCWLFWFVGRCERSTENTEYTYKWLQLAVTEFTLPILADKVCKEGGTVLLLAVEKNAHIKSILTRWHRSFHIMAMYTFLTPYLCLALNRCSKSSPLRRLSSQSLIRSRFGAARSIPGTGEGKKNKLLKLMRIERQTKATLTR